ncbi:MAG: hypothetical protein QY316_03960 [Thermodesulfobacteriota bacterium]|nr:MAG: hypothetical protein QY316_03960 [Thermodesulfobacteriota bacterium]
MKRISRFFALSTLFLFGAPAIAGAELVTIYGPVYVAKTNKDARSGTKEANFVFTAPVPGNGKVIVRNGGDAGRKSRVSSATIDLNGEGVAGRSDFNNTVESLDYDVVLLPDNNMAVRVNACNACELEITVLGEKPAPPPITRWVR